MLSQPSPETSPCCLDDLQPCSRERALRATLTSSRSMLTSAVRNENVPTTAGWISMQFRLSRQSCSRVCVLYHMFHTFLWFLLGPLWCFRMFATGLLCRFCSVIKEVNQTKSSKIETFIWIMFYYYRTCILADIFILLFIYFWICGPHILHFGPLQI